MYLMLYTMFFSYEHETRQEEEKSHYKPTLADENWVMKNNI